MGIIKRQSIKYTLANLLGVVVGMFSTLFIYPYDKEIVGLFRFLLDTSNIFVPLVLLGTPAVSTKFFPLFNDGKPGQRGFLFLLLATVLLGFCLFLSVSFGFKTQIYDYFGKKSSPLYTRYIAFIVPLVFLYVIINVFKQYCANFGRVAIPSFLEQAIKLTFPILLLLYLGHYIDLDTLIYGIVLHFIVLTVITIVYTYHIGRLSVLPNFELLQKPLIKEMTAFALYSVIGSAGSMLAMRIDTFMVGAMIDLESTGIYSIAATIATIISIPLMAVYSIASPIVSKAILSENWQEVKSIYQKSSINLLIIGLFLFLGVWCNIDDLFRIMPKSDGMQSGKYIVLCLAISKLFDLATGVNDAIIGYSKYFRFSFYLILLLALLNIAGNYIFIPYYGILGAALVPMLASIVYNFLKWAFIYYRFKLSPFDQNTLKLLGITGTTFVLTLFLPPLPSPFLSLFLKSSVITLLYLPAVLYFSISEEVNGVVEDLKKRILK